MRDAAIARADRLERAGRVARFVMAGMFLGWVADVTAAFAPGIGVEAPVYGVASLGLAVIVVSAYALAKRTLARADAIRLTTQRRFSVVRLDEATPLLMLAASNAVVAQYLRMVGRQQRPLCRIELTAMLDWAAAPAEGPKPVRGL
jgi:hypothetical protein